MKIFSGESSEASLTMGRQSSSLDSAMHTRWLLAGPPVAPVLDHRPQGLLRIIPRHDATFMTCP
uniref:Uncharacterized protein n=1 Tax=Cutibacterium granulosum DSM 20700 TaxID=1160719 RepID=A0A9X5R0R7_9ACTN